MTVKKISKHFSCTGYGLSIEEASEALSTAI